MSAATIEVLEEAIEWQERHHAAIVGALRKSIEILRRSDGPIDPRPSLELPDAFTRDDLLARAAYMFPETFGHSHMMALGLTRPQSAYSLSQWCEKGLAQKVGHGKYRRTDKFPAAAVCTSSATKEAGKTHTLAKGVVEARKPADPEPPKPPTTTIPPTPPKEAKPENTGPTGDKAVAIGRTLGQPFTATDLQARLDKDDQRKAYHWIADWKHRGWCETVGFASYRLTDDFGK